MTTENVKPAYTPWRFGWICEGPPTGGHWYFGNFAFGVEINSHPRFREFVLCLGCFVVGFGFHRDAVTLAEHP